MGKIILFSVIKKKLFRRKTPKNNRKLKEFLENQPTQKVKIKNSSGFIPSDIGNGAI